MRGVVEPVDRAVVVEVVAAGLLRDAVRRLRALRVRLRRRDLLGRAVDRAARAREHHLARAAGARALAHVERADEVHLGVELRPGHRDAHVGLRGEVEHDVGLAGRDQVGDRRRCGCRCGGTRSAGHRPRGRRRGWRGCRSRGRRRRRPPVLGEEPVGERRADEPRAARDQCLHAVPSISSRARRRRPAPRAATSVAGRDRRRRRARPTSREAGAPAPIRDVGTDRRSGRARAPGGRPCARAPTSTGASSTGASGVDVGVGLDPDARRGLDRGPGVGRGPTRPSSTSSWASKYLPGVPMSSQ